MSLRTASLPSSRIAVAARRSEFVQTGLPLASSKQPRTCVAASRPQRIVMAAAQSPLAPFEFASAGRIVFGRGEAMKRLAPSVKEFGGSKAFIVTGSTTNRAQPFADALKAAGIEVTLFSIGKGEPTLAVAEAGVKAAKAANANIVIGLGGGSAVDTGKAIAALITQPEGLLHYMEVVGKGQPITNRPVPFIAIPTTAGTGSEVTKNSVFDSPEQNVKASIRSNMMLPSLSIVDPLLTLDVPQDVTAATGLDALTQCLEPYVCNATNPLTDAISLEGLRRASRSIRAVYKDGKNIEAREDMCVASLFGGLSLANAKLGVVHGFAGPLGGMLHGPHGALCAAMLAAGCDVNVRALRERSPGSDALARFDTAAKVMTGNPNATAADGVTWIKELCKELNIPGLSAWGMTEAKIAEAVDKGGRSSSMKGNPIALTEAELREVLVRSM